MNETRTTTTDRSTASVEELKVYVALQYLNIYELNRFRKFVTSPYFNVNEKITAIYEFWEPYLRGETEGHPTRGASWSAATGKTRYNDVQFRKVCSDLLRLYEQFLVQEAFGQNSLHKADYLLEAVHKKRLDPLFNSAVRTAQRLSDQYFLRPASHYYYQYSFERWIYNLQGLEIERSREINVEQIAKNLDLFYLAEKLRYYCYVLVRKAITMHEYDLLFMDAIIQHIESEGYDDVVPINFYYQIYLTQTSPENPEHYKRLKGLINEKIYMLPEIEGKEIIDSALNYCIRRINEGKNEYLREIHDLYKDALDNQLVFINDKITPWTFRNMVVSGLRLGEYQWVEKFITDYQDRIDEKYRSNAVSFNLANLYFYKKEYDKVFSLLQEVEYDDPSYNLNSKAMLIATYYELDEIEPLLSLLSSFSTYLRRSSDITAARKEHYLNLIRFVRALTRIDGKPAKEVRALKKDIENTEGIVSKQWLLQKVEEHL